MSESQDVLKSQSDHASTKHSNKSQHSNQQIINQLRPPKYELENTGDSEIKNISLSTSNAQKNDIANNNQIEHSAVDLQFEYWNQQSQVTNKSQSQIIKNTQYIIVEQGQEKSQNNGISNKQKAQSIKQCSIQTGQVDAGKDILVSSQTKTQQFPQNQIQSLFNRVQICNLTEECTVNSEKDDYEVYKLKKLNIEDSKNNSNAMITLSETFTKRLEILLLQKLSTYQKNANYQKDINYQKDKIINQVQEQNLIIQKQITPFIFSISTSQQPISTKSISLSSCLKPSISKLKYVNQSSSLQQSFLNISSFQKPSPSQLFYQPISLTYWRPIDQSSLFKPSTLQKQKQYSHLQKEFQAYQFKYQLENSFFGNFKFLFNLLQQEDSVEYWGIYWLVFNPSDIQNGNYEIQDSTQYQDINDLLSKLNGGNTQQDYQIQNKANKFKYQTFQQVKPDRLFKSVQQDPRYMQNINDMINKYLSGKNSFFSKNNLIKLKQQNTTLSKVDDIKRINELIQNISKSQKSTLHLDQILKSIGFNSQTQLITFDQLKEKIYQSEDIQELKNIISTSLLGQVFQNKQRTSNPIVLRCNISSIKPDQLQEQHLNNLIIIIILNIIINNINNNSYQSNSSSQFQQGSEFSFSLLNSTCDSSNASQNNNQNRYIGSNSLQRIWFDSSDQQQQRLNEINPQIQIQKIEQRNRQFQQINYNNQIIHQVHNPLRTVQSLDCIQKISDEIYHQNQNKPFQWKESEQQYCSTYQHYSSGCRYQKNYINQEQIGSQQYNIQRDDNINDFHILSTVNLSINSSFYFESDQQTQIKAIQYRNSLDTQQDQQNEMNTNIVNPNSKNDNDKFENANKQTNNKTKSNPNKHLVEQEIIQKQELIIKEKQQQNYLQQNIRKHPQLIQNQEYISNTTVSLSIINILEQKLQILQSLMTQIDFQNQQVENSQFEIQQRQIKQQQKLQIGDSNYQIQDSEDQHSDSTEITQDNYQKRQEDYIQQRVNRLESSFAQVMSLSRQIFQIITKLFNQAKVEDQHQDSHSIREINEQTIIIQNQNLLFQSLQILSRLRLIMNHKLNQIEEQLEDLQIRHMKIHSQDQQCLDLIRKLRSQLKTKIIILQQQEQLTEIIFNHKNGQ